MRQHDDIASDPARPEVARATASALARALDTGDLATVGEWLAPECEFAEGATRLRGAGAIVALLRQAASWAERGFDDVRPCTTIGSVAPGIACLATTIVWMRVPGRWHRLQLERSIEVRADGRIVRLTQAADPSAARAFAAFAIASGAPPVPLGFGRPEEG